MEFGLSGIKLTVRNREMSIREGSTVLENICQGEGALRNQSL